MSFLETSVLYCDDNLRRLAQFPSNCIDLVYLDPPFFSNRFYEVIWGDEAEVRSFEDRWQGGLPAYIGWMKERMIEVRRVLKKTGTVYLHCDWHAGHYLKVMMDDVFDSRFLNEVVWYYRGGGVSPRAWARRHDTIFFYANGKEWTFNVDPVRTAYSDSVMESLPSRYDKSYRGERVYSGYKPNPLGKHPDDVWPIQPIMPSDKRERLGYPTQKPEALLERIILASSNAGDIVLDPFCGCGTTIAVAQRLGRQWIGIDISPSAVNVMKARMDKVGATGVQVYGLASSEADLRALGPFEFQNWILQRINATPSPRQRGDMGIDGLSFMEHLPIQIKQRDSVGREVVDSFETAIERSGKDAGYIIAFSFTDGAKKEAARAHQRGKVSIGLIEVEDLVKVADLIEGANLVELSGIVRQRPRPLKGTPDLIRLFAAAQAPPAKRPLPDARDAKSRPTLDQLIESARSLPR